MFSTPTVGSGKEFRSPANAELARFFEDFASVHCGTKEILSLAQPAV
jgi:hypothetical protein